MKWELLQYAIVCKLPPLVNGTVQLIPSAERQMVPIPPAATKCPAPRAIPVMSAVEVGPTLVQLVPWSVERAALPQSPTATIAAPDVLVESGMPQWLDSSCSAPERFAALRTPLKI